MSVETEILLLNGSVGSNNLWRLIGPYQLAWWLREHGYQPQVIDFVPYLTDDEILQLIDKFVSKTTKIIAWGLKGPTATHGNQSTTIVEKFIPMLRKKYPWVKFVAGGPWAHYCCHNWPNKTAFDYYLFGYAEDGMLSICEREFRGAPMPMYESIAGNIVIKDTTPTRLPEEKRFHLRTSMHRWHPRDCIEPGESLPIELGRGCRFRCSFCAFPHIGKKDDNFRRKMELVEEEMLYNYKEFGTTYYYIIDDTFNDSHPKMIEFHSMTQRLPFKIKFSCYLRPDLLDKFDDQPLLLKDSGLLSGFLGVETFNEKAAVAIRKPWAAKRGRDFLLELRNNLWKNDVSVKASMIVGLPHNTEEELREYQKWFFDNKFPSWEWKPLLIMRDLTRPFTSEFDREAQSYGFEWEEVNGDFEWKSPWMTQSAAIDLSKELNTERDFVITPEPWELLEMQNFGIDPSLILFKPIKNPRTANMIVTKRKEFLDRYKQRLMNL